MAEADDTGSTSSTPSARGSGSGRGGRRPAPSSNDPRVDGPAAPRAKARATNRNRPSSSRAPTDPLAALGGPGAAPGAPPQPLASPPSMPPPAGSMSAAAMPPPPPPPAQRAVDPLIEWSTGEVATTALAEREPEPETEAAPPVQHARPDDGRFGTRSGRTRNRPPSASGRVPTIAPATPSTPSAPSDSPADRHIEVREAMPDPTLAVRAPDVVPVMPSTDVEPEARKPDTIGLPSAEMLATLVEPEPVVDHPPEPEPEPEPEGPVLTTTARITRALPVIFRRRPRKRVRRVTRVVRHIDTWSVFKVALVFNVVLYVVCLTAGVLLWNVAYTTGTIDNVEKFFEQFGWSSFEFKGGEIYHNAWIAGLFATIGLTGLAVLLATLFNLITDLVGGVRVSVLEEEVVARSATDATIIRRRPRRERADRALAKLDQLERETAARSSTVRRGTVARFTRPASTTPASPPEP